MSQKFRRDETQTAVEEWAAMIAQMQDSGRKNESKIKKKNSKSKNVDSKTKRASR